MKKIAFIVVAAIILIFLIVLPNYIADSVTRPFTTRMNQITNDMQFNIN